MKRHTKTVILACAFFGASFAGAAQADIEIDSGKSFQSSGRLWGIFFEEINRAGSGGLCADMVMNGSFEDARVGFMGSAGHGAIFKDLHGNYWQVATMVVGVRHWFERRLGLLPVFFGEKGFPYAVTEMTDAPFFIPQKKENFQTFKFSAGMNLLSYGKPAKASSSKENFKAEKAVDERVESWWVAESGLKGERLEVDLHGQSVVEAVHVNFADEGFKVWQDGEPPVYRYKILASSDGIRWKVLADCSKRDKDAPHELIVLKKPEKARYVAVENSENLSGGVFSISGFRVFGKGSVPPPQKVSNFYAKRGFEDRRSIELSWDKSENAEKYVLRRGIEKGKLFSERTVYENFVKGSFLNAESPYFFSVQAVNSNGKSPLSFAETK